MHPKNTQGIPTKTVHTFKQYNVSLPPKVETICFFTQEITQCLNHRTSMWKQTVFPTNPPYLSFSSLHNWPIKNKEKTHKMLKQKTNLTWSINKIADCGGPNEHLKTVHFFSSCLSSLHSSHHFQFWGFIFVLNAKKEKDFFCCG